MAITDGVIILTNPISRESFNKKILLLYHPQEGKEIKPTDGL
jgi:hypothetical protein